MARSPGSRSSRATRTSPTGVGSVGFDYGTSSDIDGSNFEDPKDIADIAAIETDIGGRQPTPPRRPPMGGIDLGKGLDLEKPKPPRSAIGLEIGKSAGGNLGIGVEVPIGLSPFGARGGVAIDPATEQIRGGYGGLGIGKGPIAASVDVGVDNGGCFRYITVSVGPFSHTYGQNVCEPKQPPIPTLTPIPTPTPGGIGGSIPGAKNCKGGRFLLGGTTTYYSGSLFGVWTVEVAQALANDLENYKAGRVPLFPYFDQSETEAHANGYFGVGNWDTIGMKRNELLAKGGWVWESELYSGGHLPKAGNTGIDRQGAVSYTHSYDFIYFYPKGTADPFSATRWFTSGAFNHRFTITNVNPPPDCPLGDLPSLFSTPPIPNPPPKKMNNDCCKILVALQLETLRMMGRQVSSGQLLPVSNKPGFLGEEIDRKETPIDPKNPNKKVKIKFDSLYDLVKYSLKEQIALDEAMDPRSFERPTGKIQNPEYSRDAGQSLTSNSQPDKDKSGNKREIEINGENFKVLSVLQQQKYIFDALRRLEYLFPSGELSDALIEKSLLIPGAEGEIKIHNMIQAYEVQMQYLDAALGNPREILTIKDANPAIEGDQPIEVRSLSISDLLRQNIKFHIDTGGDVDALVNLVLRDFRTNLANRIDTIKSAEMIQALFEDSGMLEEQKYIKIHLEGDPYAGQWVKGKGFEANPDLEKRTEEATEKVLRETMKPYDIKIKVSRRHKDEKTDMRDLLRGLADFVQRLLSIPSAGDAAKSIDKLVESAKFKVQTDMALIRQNVTQAAAASRNRTKKRKK